MELIKELAAIAVVISLLLAVVMLGRRAGIAGMPGFLRKVGGRRLELIESLRIGPSHSIQLVRCDRTYLLISAHGNGCSVLSNAVDRPTGLELPDASI